MLKNEVENDLVKNILPYWINLADHEYGGFFGQVTGKEELNKNADKGAILHARILWTFSAAYRLLKKPEYLNAAPRANRFIIDHFYAIEFGGIYWSVDKKGNPVFTKKQLYAIGFAMYCCSDYNRDSGDQVDLDSAIALFHDV